MPVLVGTPPGLDLLSVEAPVFIPGASEYEIGATLEPSLPSSTPAFGEAHANNYEQLSLQYKQLSLQFNSEVSQLRHQLMELSSKYSEVMSKFVELDEWRKSMGFVHDLRVEHQAQPIVTPLPVVVERNTSEAAVPEVRSGSQIPEFDGETDLLVRKWSSEIAGPDGQKTMVESTRADWKIKHFCTKLRSAGGRPVVSCPFDLYGLKEIRLMVTPETGVKDGSTGPRTRKEKEQFSKRLSDGPLNARLAVKIPNACPSFLKYFLRVGEKVIGPLEFDFSNTAIHDCGSFDGDWLLEVGKDSSISVGMELLVPSEVADDQPVDTLVDEVISLQNDGPGMPPGLFVRSEDLFGGV